MLTYLESFVRRVLIRSGVADHADLKQVRAQQEKRAQLAIAEARAFGEQRLLDARTELGARLDQAVNAEQPGFTRLRDELQKRLDDALAVFENRLNDLRDHAPAPRADAPGVTFHSTEEKREPSWPAATAASSLSTDDWTAALRFTLPSEGSGNAALAEALRDLGHQVISCDETGPALPPAIARFPRVRVGQGEQARDILIGFDWGDTGFPLETIEWLNAHVGAVACATAHAEKILRDHGCTVPLATIGLGLGFDEWDRQARDRAYQAPGKAFRFLHVSACGEDQALPALLDAFGQVFAQDDDVSLALYSTGDGAGSLSDEIAKRRRSNPAYPDVTLVEGSLSDGELKALYAQCHVFVSAGRAEGFSPAIARAFLSGLPVVATGWGGHRDYCTSHTAWLVDFEFARAPSSAGVLASTWAEPRPEALAEALWFAYRADPAERFSKGWSGRRALIARYDWKEVALRLAKLAAATGLPAKGVDADGTIGFVTSWNSKCGIASFMRHMLGSTPPTEFLIFADRSSQPLEPEGRNVLRSWVQGPTTANELESLIPHFEPCGIKAIVIQFNYGFFNPRDFCAFIDRATKAGRRVLVEMHSTIDPPQHVLPIRLADYAPGLRQCQSVLAHSIDDLNRLKAVGVVANAVLFPHGVYLIDPSNKHSAKVREVPQLASFGYALPHKGLLELVEATALLVKKGVSLQLTLANAAHPDPISSAYIEKIRARIAERGLQEIVNLKTDYLDDAECIALLSSADLVIQPYQETAESASGAVRFALSSGTPVMVSPLPIFDELDGVVWRSNGTSPPELAISVLDALKSIRARSAPHRRMREAALAWRTTHDIRHQGNRLMRIAHMSGSTISASVGA